MADTVLLIAGLLGAGFLATKLSSTLRVPHSVLLVLLGITAGLLLKIHNQPLPPDLWSQFPEMVLYVLLPPLIFESAYHINFLDLKRDLIPVTSLAIAALFISCFIVGAGLNLLFAIPLTYALVFGALISATDPVAVVALFRAIGAPHRLSTIVEGESLLNDGTAIVLFRILVFISAGTIQGNVHISGITSFISVTAGGLLVGLAFIALMSLLLRLTSSSAGAQLGFTVASAYGSFIIADHWLHVSGIIATLTVGLYLGSRARLELNRDALKGMQGIWEFMALCANILVFLAIGFSVDFSTLLYDFSYIPWTILLVYMARAVSVTCVLEPLRWFRIGHPVRPSYQAVIIWGGLRGGLALAMVLMLPPHFPYRHQFLAMATSVVLAYLLINALTTVPLMRQLKLTSLSRKEQVFHKRSLAHILIGIFSTLTDVAERGSLSPRLVSDIRERTLGTLAGEEDIKGDSPYDESL